MSKVTVTAFIEEKDKEALQELANKEKRSLSNYIALLIEKHLEQKKKG